MQKWGSDARGKPRFRCFSCGSSSQRRRPDVTQKYRLKLFKQWLLGKLELSWYASKYGVTRQTLAQWFAPFWHDEPQPQAVDTREAVLVIDAKVIDFSAVVLVVATRGSVVTWYFAHRETSHTWRATLSQLKHIPFAIVCDGQRGMLKAIHLLFPRVIVQRCQFHVVQYCLAKLTQKPESVAGQELRELVLHITKVTTRAEFQVWLEEYITWRHTYRDFLTEKTYQPLSLTPTGRSTWHYTHGRLHAAHSHLKNALPNLFTYLRYPEIPNTTNSVEGGINALMQEKLRSHRGLTLSQRRVLIAHFLFSKQ
jgi:phage-related protein